MASKYSIVDWRVCQVLASPVWSRLDIVLMFGDCETYKCWQLKTPAERLDRLEQIMGKFSNAFRTLRSSAPNEVFSDVSFAAEYPTLFAFLAQEVDDDGKPRQTSTLLLLVEGGQAKGCLKDRDHDVSLWRSSSSILGVLGELEAALCADVVDWRQPYKAGHRR